MTVILFIVIVALFVALTPGILLSLPPKGSKLVVALTHGIVFAIVLKLIYKPLKKLFSGKEGMKEGVDTDLGDEFKDVKDFLENNRANNVEYAIKYYLNENNNKLIDLMAKGKNENRFRTAIKALIMKRAYRGD